MEKLGDMVNLAIQLQSIMQEQKEASAAAYKAYSATGKYDRRTKLFKAYDKASKAYWATKQSYDSIVYKIGLMRINNIIESREKFLEYQSRKLSAKAG